MKNLLTLLVLITAASCSQPDIIYLDEIDVSKWKSGWGKTQIKQSVTNGPILINGREFGRGIGTHSTSTFLLGLNGHGMEFSAVLGPDDASEGNGSIKFYVLGDKRILWESDIMTKGSDSTSCRVDLRGINKLGLLVDDGGDGISYDHANWADAFITYRKEKPSPSAVITEEEYILTPPAPDQPRINGPGITGVRPGSPFLYRIPATGKRPIKFDVINLPGGIDLDTGTGIISGVAPGRGDYKIKLKAANDYGSDEKEFIIRVGDTLALTPHMGWNSWYIHYNRVSDAIMREAADQMIETGMADYGYQYVNIDDCWMVKVNSDDPEIGGQLRDNKGKLLTNKRFPDMNSMTDYIHSKGLKAGTYISPGPATCAGYAGSYQHEAQDAKTFSNWGFDFLKYDWCSYGRVEPPETRDDYIKPYRLMWSELNKQERDIVLNLCQYGMESVWEWGGDVGNSWRTTGDLGLASGSGMPGFYNIGRSNAEHWQYARPGNWNDPDYILIGWVGSAHGMGEGEKTTLSPSEQYFYMSMWSLMAAPLIFSGDMAKLDDFTLNILCNHEVIAVNQDILGKQAKIIREDENELVMLKELADGSKAVGLFHITGSATEPADHFEWGGREPVKISVNWSEIGENGKMKVRDLWRQKDLGEFEDGITLEVPYHGVQMIRINMQ